MECNWFLVKIEETIRCSSSTIFAYANSTVPLTRFPIKSSKKETRSDRRFSVCQRPPRMKSREKKRNIERKRFATEELARSGQSANEVANVGSSVPDKILIQIGRVTPSRVRRDPGLTLNYHPYLNFTQQGQKSELRARNSCSTRRRRNLRMKRREEKWEEEESGREEGEVGSVPT